MLASEEGGNSDPRRFNLASDIVELIVLTGDDPFLQTLRDAVGETRRLWHVPSPDKVSDLLVAGQVGILVLDVAALHEAAALFIGEIKRQFPDLVVVVAGVRDDESSLAGLISSGMVYRFIHKPMSPARARLFADAAVKKFEGQRHRVVATPVTLRRTPTNPGLLIGGLLGAAALALVAVWALHRGSGADAALRQTSVTVPAQAAESALLARAAAALAANRLIAPSGDNALELYLQDLARYPLDAAARAGLAEVRERLLARAENALLEERLDEAAIAIETARKAGVESGRIAFLTAQLAKSREQAKAAQIQARAATGAAKSGATPDKDRIAQALSLAAQRLDEGHVSEPDRDNAGFYIQQALQIDPDDAAAQDLEQTLALRLLSDARGAIDRRDFMLAASRLAAAKGIAAPANIEIVQQLLADAQRRAATDSVQLLLKTANDRLLQDRLIQPTDDSAKYYLLTVRGLDPTNAALGAALQDLGARLVAKARRALTLEQYEAARSWLEEATAIGYSSADSTGALQDLDTAVVRQKFLANVVAANELTLLKSVQPIYPQKAQANKVEGWVELDFTVAESGEVKDVSVHGSSAPGVFDEAAIGALSQWRYRPVLSDTKPVPQRARIRIRFKLAA